MKTFIYLFNKDYRPPRVIYPQDAFEHIHNKFSCADTERTPIHYVTLHGSAMCSFAPLRPCYENRAEFTILMCEQEPYPVWLSCRR